MIRNATNKGMRWLGVAVALVVMLATTVARADTWRGTAPFCDGQCNPGEVQIASSNCGDGACCWTGQKVLCRNSAPLCQPKQTLTQCYGVVLVCDNGYYIGGSSPSWVSCGKFACGACFGFSF